MKSIYMKKGDTRPAVTATIKNADGSAVDLTGATLRFVMKIDGGTTAKVDASATVLVANLGTVKYQWISGDTDTVGTYKAEWKISYGDGTVLRAPNNSYIAVVITDVLS